MLHIVDNKEDLTNLLLTVKVDIEKLAYFFNVKKTKATENMEEFNICGRIRM